MGGCYNDRGSSSRESSCSRSAWQKDLDYFKDGKKKENLILAYKGYFQNKSSGGFIKEVAKIFGIEDIAKIPKEFSDLEYEVKFNISPEGSGEEPSIACYLNAFDFTAGGSARFLKDPVHSLSEGINNFYGDDLDEKLVVIEKGGKLYAKEKGEVLPVKVGFPEQHIIIKRSETRNHIEVSELLEKTLEMRADEHIKYRGKIRKEKGDDFILDTYDGRLYSFTITRAHLIKPDEKQESRIQRQLEIEYAGFIPGFSNFEKDSEKQIAKGMIDLAKYVYVLYGKQTPLDEDWTFDLQVTGERKYDFILGNGIKELKYEPQQKLFSPRKEIPKELVQVGKSND